MGPPTSLIPSSALLFEQRGDSARNAIGRNLFRSHQLDRKRGGGRAFLAQGCGFWLDRMLEESFLQLFELLEQGRRVPGLREPAHIFVPVRRTCITTKKSVAAGL